jgi:hypothetical protein
MAKVVLIAQFTRRGKDTIERNLPFVSFLLILT